MGKESLEAPNRSGKTQLDKFKEAQREHETDQSQEHFDAALKRVAKAGKTEPAKPDVK